VAKVRVYELAKELGMESKDVLAKLQELGEFVRSASSTVEPPVVRKMRDLYPAAAPKSEDAKPKAKKAPAKKAAKKAPEIPAELEAVIMEAQAARDRAAEAADQKPTFIPPVSPAPSATTPSKPAQLPQMPRPPRAGNNPFGTSAAPRPPRPGQGQTIRPGQRPPMAGPRPGAVRPGFAARPQQGGPGRPGGPGRHGGPGGAGRPGGGPGGSSPYRSQGSRPGAPSGGGFAGRPSGGGGPGRPGGPGGRGTTAGAFGKGKKKSKIAKSKKAKREELDNMQAPVLGGVRITRGDGAKIRLRRGATLSDLAEKIGA
jgi:translation initiation factor IF-2